MITVPSNNMIQYTGNNTYLLRKHWRLIFPFPVLIISAKWYRGSDSSAEARQTDIQLNDTEASYLQLI